MSINCQLKEVEYIGINYAINIEDKTACAISLKNPYVIIPRSIVYQSQEYIITNIIKHIFKYSDIKSIKISSDSNLQIFNDDAFSNSMIRTITFPTQVEKIGKHSFASCNFLKRVEIQNDSKPQSIEKEIFLSSSIERLKIPPRATKIGERSFSFCKKTQKNRNTG